LANDRKLTDEELIASQVAAALDGDQSSTIPADKKGGPQWVRLRRKTVRRSITRTGAQDNLWCSAMAGPSVRIAGRLRCCSWPPTAIAHQRPCPSVRDADPRRVR